MKIKKGKVTQLNLLIRILVGGYLLYLVYDIVSGKPEYTPFLIAGVAILFLAGAAIVIWSAFLLIKKDYYDPSSEEEETEISENTMKETAEEPEPVNEREE